LCSRKRVGENRGKKDPGRDPSRKNRRQSIKTRRQRSGEIWAPKQKRYKTHTKTKGKKRYKAWAKHHIPSWRILRAPHTAIATCRCVQIQAPLRIVVVKEEKVLTTDPALVPLPFALCNPKTLQDSSANPKSLQSRPMWRSDGFQSCRVSALEALETLAPRVPVLEAPNPNSWPGRVSVCVRAAVRSGVVVASGIRRGVRMRSSRTGEQEETHKPKEERKSEQLWGWRSAGFALRQCIQGMVFNLCATMRRSTIFFVSSRHLSCCFCCCYCRYHHRLSISKSVLGTVCVLQFKHFICVYLSLFRVWWIFRVFLVEAAFE